MDHDLDDCEGQGVRLPKPMIVISAVAFLLSACTFETTGDDPAEMEDVEQFPGDQNGDAEDAEGRAVPEDDEVGEDAGEADPADPVDGDEPREREETVDVDAPDGAVLAVRSTDLGEHLVDGDGWPVYANVEDESPPVACVGECLANWPILATDEEPVLGEGLDPELVTTLERDDGTPQLAYAGYPLHIYAHDEGPDSFDGHGIDGEWSVISPEGELLLENEGDDDG